MSSAALDANWYLNRYPDVSGSGLAPLEHYELVGKLLGRKPALDDSAPPVTERPASPKVSIVCVCYNQERYIHDAIKGFLMQETDFPIEIIIADDASTDRTPEIIAKYAAGDSRIVPVLRTKNLGSVPNWIETLNLARGEYVAMCEGDDYWVDPQKLKLQVEFLDGHPHHAICFHPVKLVWEGIESEESVYSAGLHHTISLPRYIHSNCIQTNSVMYRWRFRGNAKHEIPLGIMPIDYYLHLRHAEVGRIGYIDRIMGVYRRHAGGLWSIADPNAHHRKYLRGELLVLKDLAKRYGGYFKDDLLDRAAEMFRSYAEHLLRENDFAALWHLSKDEPEIAARAYKGMRFDPPKLDYDSADSLRQSMRDQHRVSVVIVAGAKGGSLELTLASVLAQRGYFDLEVVLAAGSHEEADARRIRELSKRYPHARLRTLSTAEADCALHAAFKAASGEFVAICKTGDQWISPAKLMKQLQLMQHNPNAAMCFHWVLAEDPATGRLTPDRTVSEEDAETVLLTDIAHNNAARKLSSCFYRRDALERVPERFYDLPAALDWMLNLHAAEAGRVLCQKDVMAACRIEGSDQALRRTERHKTPELDAIEREHLLSIGIAKGLDGKSLDFRILGTELPNVVAQLENPVHERSGFLHRNAIEIVGWAVHELGKELQLVTRTADRMQVHSMNVERADIAHELDLGGRFPVWERKHGFSVDVAYDLSDEFIDLGLRYDGETYWWKRIFVSLR